MENGFEVSWVDWQKMVQSHFINLHFSQLSI
jgi:hypothetical protein